VLAPLTPELKEALLFELFIFYSPLFVYKPAPLPSDIITLVKGKPRPSEGRCYMEVGTPVTVSERFPLLTG
jgi:hypothetical protein